MRCGWSTSEWGVEGGLLEGMIIRFSWFGGLFWGIKGAWLFSYILEEVLRHF